MLTRRICIKIKSFFNWWSFPLFSWPLCLIQGRYCKEKLAISKLPLASFSKQGLVLNHLYENEFKLHMNLTYYHMKGWAPGLALKKKPKIIWKWPIRHESLWGIKGLKCSNVFHNTLHRTFARLHWAPVKIFKTSSITVILKELRQG